MSLQAAHQLVEGILYEKATPANLKTFEVKSLNSYTDGLVAVATALKQFGPCCVLVSLRGGVKPCEFLDTMLNREMPFGPFAYTNNSDPDLFQTYGAIFVRRFDGRGHLAVSHDTRRAVNKTFSHLSTDRMHERFKRYPEHDRRGDFAKFFRQQR